MDEASPNAILQFCEMAGCDPDVAASYLEVSGGDVETALSLFFENGGAPLVQSSSSGPVPGDMPGLNNDFEPPSSQSPSPSSRGQQAGEEVRAPIARQYDTLVSGPVGYGVIPGMVPADASGLSYSTLGGTGRAGPPEAFRDFSHEADRRATRDSRQDRLADLFRPPTDIMYPGDFDSGRATAQNRNKWILVNVQDPTEFQCQLLNRDLWSSQDVKDVVSQNFVFMQYGIASQEGQRYINFYKVHRYPHVAIIDPRTGEKTKEFNALADPAEFVQELYDFLDRNSLTEFKSRPKKAEGPKKASEMSEDEQLLAAMQASLEAGSGAGPLPEPPRNQQGSLFERIPAVEHKDPPGDDKSATRVQIRLPDGQRVVKKLLLTDPVRFLFEHLKATVPEVNGKTFDLVSPTRQNLSEVLEQTVGEAKVAGASINLVYP